jgi:hypothetical protein
MKACRIDYWDHMKVTVVSTVCRSISDVVPTQAALKYGNQDICNHNYKINIINPKEHWKYKYR